MKKLAMFTAAFALGFMLYATKAEAQHHGHPGGHYGYYPGHFHGHHGQPGNIGMNRYHPGRGYYTYPRYSPYPYGYPAYTPYSYSPYYGYGSYGTMPGGLYFGVRR